MAERLIVDAGRCARGSAARRARARRREFSGLARDRGATSPSTARSRRRPRDASEVCARALATRLHPATRSLDRACRVHIMWTASVLPRPRPKRRSHDAGRPSRAVHFCLPGAAAGSREGHRRPSRDHRPRADRHVRRRSRAARRRARARQDAAHQDARRGARPVVLAHPVHAGPDAGGHHRHEHHRGGRGRPEALPVPVRARSSRTSCSPTRSTARRRRRSPRCSRACRRPR